MNHPKNNNQAPGPGRRPPRVNRGMLIYLAVVLVLIYIASGGLMQPREEAPTYRYSEIVALLEENKISEYTLDLGSGEMTFKLRGEEKEQTYTVPNVSLFYDAVQTRVDAHNADAAEADRIAYDLYPVKDYSTVLSYLPTIILVVMMIALWYFTMRQTKNGNMSGFGKAKLRTADGGRKVTFADVAGADEEKEELVEIVEFLKNPGKFNSLGARIPKGVLLVGPPGTGKTLLARAVAGEAGAPFFSISGSDFVEMFVGVGASRVRDLFDQAKKNAPSIIFIDEIDAVGRQRGAGLGGGHDEREQTLNQLLVEMDGFATNSGVIVIAATNRRDILDPALMRPGRFDRQIIVNYPDINGREAILRVHARNKPMAPDVDLKVIAGTTAGFTGADLENILNEAALLAARQGLKAITMAVIEDATIKVVAGPEKKSRLITDKDKRLTAYHEAGHAVVTYYMDTADRVHQVSIIPRGMAGGYTMSLPTEDKSYRTRGEMKENIVTLLAGRVAESLVLDDISTGASNDLERATAIARSMVTRYGFSEKLGTVVYGQDQGEVFLGRDFGHTRNYSEEVANEIDEEIRTIISSAYEIAKNTLEEHMDQLELIAQNLIRREKLEESEFDSLMKTGFFPGEAPEKIENEKESEPAAQENAGTESTAPETPASGETPPEEK